MYRDGDLQANYDTICEAGVPDDTDAARQQVKNTVESIQPVVIAGAYSRKFDDIPVHVGHLENQTFQRFKEVVEDDAVEEAKMRSQLTEATDISKVKRGTLIRPQHFLPPPSQEQWVT